MIMKFKENMFLEPIIIKEWRESVLHRVIVPDLIPEGQNNVNSSSKLKCYPHYKQKHKILTNLIGGRFGS